MATNSTWNPSAWPRSLLDRRSSALRLSGRARVLALFGAWPAVGHRGGFAGSGLAGNVWGSSAQVSQRVSLLIGLPALPPLGLWCSAFRFTSRKSFQANLSGKFAGRAVLAGVSSWRTTAPEGTRGPDG